MTEIVLYGTKEQEFEKNALSVDVLSTQPENILAAIYLAKKDGYKVFRIVDYTEEPITPPNFTKTIQVKK